MTEERKNIMLGTAGHVDHGKTALVKLLTGCDTDRLDEEKQRGLTIELGFAPCVMADDRIVGIVDVPGHVNFIKNMVAGAHGVDVVMLVVAADDGVMPQTREHLDILTLMGVRRGLIALTKIDLVDPQTRKLAVEELRDFVRGTFLEDKAVCEVSNVTGEGFEDFLAALNAEVAASEPVGDEGIFRQWIERVFPIRGFGTVVSGIPKSGRVRVGDRLHVLPGGAMARVRKMEVYGRASDVGRAGECVALNLADVEADELARGMLLSGGESFSPVEMFEATLGLLPCAPGELPDYAEVHLHVGTAEVMANVALLEGQPIPPYGEAMVQMRCREAVPVALGERFVIRAAGREGRLTTIGGGRVLGRSNRKLRRKRPWTLESLAALRDVLDDEAAWLAEHLRQARAALSPQQWADRAQRASSRIESHLPALLEGGRIRPCGDRYAHSSVLADAGEDILGALEAFHRMQPHRLGQPGGELSAALELDDTLFATAVETLISEGRIERQGELLSLAGRSSSLSEEERDVYNRLSTRLREAGLAPPRIDELPDLLRADAERIDLLLQRLCDEGRAVRLDERIAMHADAVDAARRTALELFADGGGFETVEFRDALGVSRKFAVPLLDYLDTVRWTVRTGSRRTPGVEARKAMNEQTERDKP